MPTPSDLVHDQSSSTGTGNLTLTAVNGKRSFNTAFGTGGSNVFDYFISNQSAAEWEIGTGHLSAATTFVRDTVVSSSNANALVNFSGGTKDICNDVPAARQITTEAIATQANQEAAASVVLVVTPGRQQFHPSAPKYWMRTTVSGGTPTLQANYNVTSITDTATGRLTITINVDFSSASWCNVPGITVPSGTDLLISNSSGTIAAGSIEISACDHFGTLTDPVEWHSVGLGDQ